MHTKIVGRWCIVAPKCHACHATRDVNKSEKMVRTPGMFFSPSQQVALVLIVLETAPLVSGKKMYLSIGRIPKTRSDHSGTHNF